MKLAIVSDIHANAEALRATLDAIRRIGANRIVCLGDIVGYNTDPAECIALLRGAKALCMAGNHDRAVTGQITTETFSPTAARAVAWTRARLGAPDIAFLRQLPLKAVVDNHLIAVHGALHPDAGCEIVRLNSDEQRSLSFAALRAHPSGIRICAFGHTHDLGVYEMRDGVARRRTGNDIPLRADSYYLVNPGSVGQPRGEERRASFLMLDVARAAISLHYVEHDAAAAFAKTRRAGLAPPFSFLPEPVRAGLKRGVRAAGLYDFARRLAG